MSLSKGIKMLTGPSEAVRFNGKRDLSASIDLKASVKKVLNDDEYGV